MIQMSAVVVKSFMKFLIILKILAKGGVFFDPNNSSALINHLFYHKYLTNTENNI